MWVDRSFTVADRHVTASIRVLDPNQRRTVAASVAWLANQSAGQGDPHTRVWKTLVEDVLGPHVALTVDHVQPERLDWRWWSQTIRQVAAVFIDVNELSELIGQAWTTLPDGSDGSTKQ